MSQPANQLTVEQIAALQDLIARQRLAAEAANQPTSQPWTIRQGDQELQFRDPADLQNRLAEIERQHEAALAAERVRAQATQQQLEALQSQLQQQAPPPPAVQPAEFDKETYARYFLEDPRKAQKYWMQHDDELKNFFGGVAQKIVQLENDLSTERQERAAELFVSQTPDYVPDPANFQALEGIIKEQGLDWNYANLKMAWAYAKDQGVALIGEAEPEGGEAADQFIAGPPMLQRRSTQVEPDDILAQFETMTPQQQKAYLESLAPR